MLPSDPDAELSSFVSYQFNESMRVNNWLNFGFLLLFLAATAPEGFSQSPFLVYGQLRAIMQHGDLSAKVSLDTAKWAEGAMGLGVIAGLKGEIIMIYGQTYSSSVHEGKIETRTGNDVKAAMFVVVNGESPIGAYEVKEGVSSILHLADIIELNLDHASHGTGQLAFLINAENADVNYHVIDWKDGVAHTPENHKQFAKTGQLKGEKVTIVGFFSEKGAGIFTPHSSKIHLHVYCHSKGIVGHVDDVKLNGAVTIAYY
jgi:acetolactate decarboxylase